MSKAKSKVVAEPEVAEGRFDRFRAALRKLYHGRGTVPVRFQIAVLIVDLAIIAFFIASPVLRGAPTFLWIDFAIALLLLVDLMARALAASDFWRWFRQPTSIVDLVILATLLVPTVLANFGFLRILRLWTLSRSGFLWRALRDRGMDRWEETGQAIVNLLTFIFVVSGFVYTFFAGQSTGIDGYIDALYFTVATMTTTGFGDITLAGSFGKLTSIVVMVVGITLFVRLAQVIVRPFKVTFPCPQCGLQRHDPDAVHCKACGLVLAIPDDGD